MSLVVVTDIFGISSALNELVASCSELYETTTIVDPYCVVNMHFTYEKVAYQNFMKNCGLNTLAEKLEIVIEGMSSEVDIVGFSVGGTCAWDISANSSFNHIRKITCFYGSRIRDRLSVSPRFSTRVIFPRHEESFDVEPVIQALEKKTNTDVVRTEYLHGFMNKKSINFSATGYQYFNKLLTGTGNAMT